MRFARGKIMVCQVLGLALAVACGGALADGRPPALDRPIAGSLADAGRACREWTDGCSICLRGDDGAFGCSVPGIACQPTPIVCRVPLAPRSGGQGGEGPR